MFFLQIRAVFSLLALFDKNCQLRNAEKHKFAKAIAILANYDPLKCFWNHCDTCLMVVRCSTGLFGERMKHFWLFMIATTNTLLPNMERSSLDGYTGPSTKVMAHLKRSKIVGRQVLYFTQSMKITTTKEEFLSCTPRFIEKLGRHLK